tara:strand:- start:204 stop:1706 length:1503 start_codon:yes stop_codon:yes gene_type:complete
MIDSFLLGLEAMANIWSIGAALTGLIAGIIIGALPGLTATMTVAVLTPFTFFMAPLIGLPFLLGVYKGAIYAGSIPAILINTPGTAAAAATTLDGHVLAREGKARKALLVSLYASVIGDMLATIVLIAVTAPLAAIAIKFTSPEFTILFLFALTMIAGVSGNSLAKGLIAATLGAWLGCIGLDPMSGMQRFTFGFAELTGGISLIPVLIGMFALSEILIQSEKSIVRSIANIGDTDNSGVSRKELKSLMPTILRSTGLGIFLGALPGLGAEIACWLSYASARRRSKTPEKFGKGSLEGIAAAESGNNATVPATLIPMLVFGIPGDTVTAVLLGAFMAQGLLAGPLLFQQHGDIIYGLFCVLLLTNVMLLVFGFWAIQHLRKIVFIPRSILLPCVTVLCFAGAYAVSSDFFDVLVMLGGGGVGYLMRKVDMPIPPFVIGLLLAPRLENAMRQSLLFGDGSLIIFVERPISAGLLLLFVASFALLVWKSFRARRQKLAAGMD